MMLHQENILRKNQKSNNFRHRSLIAEGFWKKLRYNGV